MPIGPLSLAFGFVGQVHEEPTRRMENALEM
jgi:hypothetical protein